MNFVGTVFSLFPGIIAIVVALITKQVYLSLFISILVGCLLIGQFSIEYSVITLIDVVKENILDSSNLKILVFLVLLGVIVQLITISGGSKAYGDYVSKKVKSKKSALLSTFFLGILLFIDDYFNCLTVGSVMSSVTDRYQVSKAKLAYIIDSTAAPICIIAPISSWAAAVSGYSDGDGFILFIQTIPYNLYALLTIFTVVFVVMHDMNIGSMKKSEEIATSIPYQETKSINSNASIFDLIIPILFLIITTIITMLYTGGFFLHWDIVNAFIYCDASLALVIACVITLLFIFIYYVSRKIITISEYIKAIPKGAKTMIPAMKILILAWTLGSIVSTHLEVGNYVVLLLEQYSIPLSILPCVLFLFAILLSFSTGSSWGTFGILIPIVTSIFGQGELGLVYNIAAILAGAVAGDHMSPISDTSIMASTGANCDHLEHVQTQLPYAFIVVVSCFVGYLVIGFTTNLVLGFSISFLLLLIILLILKNKNI